MLRDPDRLILSFHRNHSQLLSAHTLGCIRGERRLFAGIDLDGTSVSQNSDDTELYFGQPHTFESVLKGNVEVPDGAKSFVLAVAHYFIEAKHHE